MHPLWAVRGKRTPVSCRRVQKQFMNPLRISQQEIFNAANAITDAEQREAYLRESCGDDEQLRCQVQLLLEAYAEAEGFLESRQDGAGTRADIGARSGDVIGRYRLLSVLGEGGFGTVWMAEQREPVRRRVALKLIKLGMDTKQVIARFEAERQALALMNHPNIAKVFDAGATDTGRPYFVMELVTGVPILEYCQRERIDTRQRLELFIDICKAIQHAHQKGIIHRDIKPNNILITFHEGAPAPKVIDFGIAKATTGQLTEKTLFTQHRQLIGTPAYMSPEQAEMSAIDVDTRTDIYALGVLLYELLTGLPPFSNEELLSKGFAEMMRLIREVEPPRPSTRVSKSIDSEIGSRRRNPRKLHLLLRGELDWIVMKCLEKDRRRRYDTASALAQDVRRYLSGDAVQAAPPSATYCLRKYLRRHRTSVSLAAVILFLLLIGLAGTGFGLRRALIAHRGQFAAAMTAQVGAERARMAEAAATRQAYAASMLAASDALERWSLSTAREYLLQAPQSLRGWEWRHMASRLGDARRVHPRSTNAGPRGVLFSLDAELCWTVDNDELLAWDLQSGSLRRTIVTHPGLVQAGQFQAGNQLFTAHRSGDGEQFFVRFWESATGTLLGAHVLRVPYHESYAGVPLGMLQQPGRISYVRDSCIVLYDMATRSERISAPIQPFLSTALAVHPRGLYIIATAQRGCLILVDPESLEVIQSQSVHTNAIHDVQFTADADRALTASADGTLQLWSVEPRAMIPQMRLVGHTGPVRGARFSPDGRLVASTGLDGTVRLWDARTGAPRGIFAAESFAPATLVFVDEGRTVAASDLNGAIRFWDVRSAESHILRGHQSFVYPVLLAHDDALVISGGWDGFVDHPGCLKFWDTQSGTPIASLGKPGEVVRAAAIAPDGARLAMMRTGNVEILDLHTGMVVLEFPSPPVTTALDYRPDGRVLAVRGYDDTVLFDAQSGRIVHRFPRLPKDHTTALSWSPDGKFLATISELEQKLTLWDAESFAPVRSWPHAGASALAFSPEVDRIVTAGDDGKLRIWQIDGTLLAVLRGHAQPVLCIAFSPDGKYIASGGRDNNVRLWNAENFDQIARFAGHRDYVYSLAWSRDGERLISGSGDHTVRIWDTVAPADRLAAQYDWQRIAAEVEPLVHRLFDQLIDPRLVVEQLNSDLLLPRRSREIALQLALRISIQRYGPP
jgi:eukaryotic-like serine/threonine-protein kinase